MAQETGRGGCHLKDLRAEAIGRSVTAPFKGALHSIMVPAMALRHAASSAAAAAGGSAGAAANPGGPGFEWQHSLAGRAAVAALERVAAQPALHGAGRPAVRAAHVALHTQLLLFRAVLAACSSEQPPSPSALRGAALMVFEAARELAYHVVEPEYEDRELLRQAVEAGCACLRWGWGVGAWGCLAVWLQLLQRCRVLPTSPSKRAVLHAGSKACLCTCCSLRHRLMPCRLQRCRPT